MKDSIPQLSKSRFTSGLQCHKRLYLELYNSGERDPLSTSQQTIFASGQQVGELARQAFPGGILITEGHEEHDLAIAKTQLAMQANSTLYEAAFCFDAIKIRVDILHKNADGTFQLIEVKSAASLKLEHIPDIAIQFHVLKGCGIKVKQSFIMHIDSSYVYPGGSYDLKSLYALREVTEQVNKYQKEIPSLLKAMRQPLFQDTIPQIAVGSHCTRPHRCSFFEYCHRALPKDHIRFLPNSSEKLLNQLRAKGISTITQIPEDISGLKNIHRRVRDVLLSNKAYFDKRVAETIHKLQEPVAFIDFETFNPALPLYINTRPYQQIPFQWSVHILAGEDLKHFEFLAEGSDDPRRDFAKALIRTLSNTGPILVYSSFEKTCLKGLADLFPEFKSDLEILWRRFFDVYGLIKGSTYHPDYKGSFSLKTVLPALIPAMTYGDLAIADGGAASAAFLALRSPTLSIEAKQGLSEDLLAYCQRDTLALVAIYKFLRNL